MCVCEDVFHIWVHGLNKAHYPSQWDGCHQSNEDWNGTKRLNRREHHLSGWAGTLVFSNPQTGTYTRALLILRLHYWLMYMCVCNPFCFSEGILHKKYVYRRLILHWYVGLTAVRKYPVWQMLQKLGKKDEGMASSRASGNGQLMVKRKPTGLSSNSSWAIMPWSEKNLIPKPLILHLLNELFRPEILQGPFLFYKSKIRLSIGNNT